MAAIMGQKSYIRLLQITFLFFISGVHNTCGVEKRKTHNMIYYDIKGYSPCVRRFNATHEIGCTSEFDGNNGVVHLIQEAADIDWLRANGTYAPYIALMTPQMFNLTNVEKLLALKKINGIMVDHSNATALIDDDVPFSSDKTCPNDNYGAYYNNPEYAHCARVTWNPFGNGMNFMNFEIPVFALTNPEEVAVLKECYETHNRPDAQGNAQPFPQCAAEIYNFMFGAKDTPTCTWRTHRMTNLETSQYCDPLGDNNVWGTLVPTNKSTPLGDKSIIIAAAQLDATGLFYNVMPRTGAENAVSGFVTLLAAAQALSTLSPAVKAQMTNIMFTFFQGESYDYIGSSRMVYDMNRGVFPMELKDDQQQPSQVNLTSIAAFLEVRQLALSQGSNFYAHIDPVSQSDPETQQNTSRLLQLLKKSATGTGIQINDILGEQPLPPASFQQFLRHQEEEDSSNNIPGVVIADHNSAYLNKYFNSRMDIPEVFGINYTEYNSTDDLPLFPVATTLANVATTVARTLYQYALPTATDADTLVADEDLVNDLLFCFNQRANCSRIREVVSPDFADSLINLSYDLYVGVYGHPNMPTQLVGQLLSYYLGEHEAMSQDDAKEKCKGDDDDKIFGYSFIRGPNYNESTSMGLCVKSTVSLSPALSPAFDDENPSWDSTVYSTWTESQWKSMFVRTFLKPSRSQESVTFCIGMIVIVLSLSTTYFLNKKADDLFP